MEKIIEQTTFAWEQDRLELISIFHAAHVEAGNGKTVDLELLLNQIGGIFKPDGETPEDDDILHASISAQVCKTNFKHLGAVAQ